MAPFAVLIRATAPNKTSFPLPTSPIASQRLSSSTGANVPITNIIFGILACFIGVVTIWQAHRAWHIWHSNHNSSRPRPSQHVQNSTNVMPSPHSATPDSSADGPPILSRTADETTATISQPPEGPTTSVLSERSGIQLAQENLIPMDELRPVSTDDEDVQHVPGV